MRYYVKATGDACYDTTGITFPNSRALNLAKIVKEAGGKRIAWARQNGWNNQPKVITFAGDENVRHTVEAQLSQRTLPLAVRSHWRQRAKQVS
jgi:hypothetical protein